MKALLLFIASLLCVQTSIAGSAPVTTTLRGAISATERTLTLASVDGLSPMTEVVIENEQILICSVNKEQSTVLACSYGRGRSGSTPTPHAAGVKVLINPTVQRDANGNVALTGNVSMGSMLPGSCPIVVAPNEVCVKASGADDSAAIQAAIIALAAAGGGKLLLAAGVYTLNGALTNNNVITLPYVPYLSASASAPMTIEIIGVQTPAFSYRDNPGVVAMGTTGTIIQTSVSGAANLIGTTSVSSGINNITNLQFLAKNILFRSYDNPNVTMLNLGNVSSARVDEVACDTNTSTQSITTPSHVGGICVVLPRQYNGADTVTRNIKSQGYYAALSMGEHAILEGTTLCQSNFSCLRFSSITGYIDIRAGRVLSQNNVHGIFVDGTANPGSIYAPGTYNIQIDQFSDGSEATPLSPLESIYDPNSLLSGQVNYWTAGVLSMAGGRYLRLVDLSNVARIQPLTDGPTITWSTYQTENLASVTLGGNRVLSMHPLTGTAFGTLYVTQDGTGSRTLTLPAGSVIRGGFTNFGLAPLSPVAGATDVLTWTYDGSTFWWDYKAAMSALPTSNITLSSGVIRGGHSTWYAPSVGVSLGSGTLSIMPLTSTSGIRLNGVKSALTYDFTGHSWQAHVTAVAGGTGADVDTWMDVGPDAENCVYLLQQGGNLKFVRIQGGLTMNVASVSYTGTFDSTKAYWRIRSSGTTLYGEYSADGASWTTLGSIVPTWALTGVRVGLEAGSEGSATGISAATFDTILYQ